MTDMDAGAKPQQTGSQSQAAIELETRLFGAGYLNAGHLGGKIDTPEKEGQVDFVKENYAYLRSQYGARPDLSLSGDAKTMREALENHIRQLPAPVLARRIEDLQNEGSPAKAQAAAALLTIRGNGENTTLEALKKEPYTVPAFITTPYEAQVAAERGNLYAPDALTETQLEELRKSHPGVATQLGIEMKGEGVYSSPSVYIAQLAVKNPKAYQEVAALTGQALHLPASAEATQGPQQQDQAQAQAQIPDPTKTPEETPAPQAPPGGQTAPPPAPGSAPEHFNTAASGPAPSDPAPRGKVIFNQLSNMPPMELTDKGLPMPPEPAPAQVPGEDIILNVPPPPPMPVAPPTVSPVTSESLASGSPSSGSTPSDTGSTGIFSSTSIPYMPASGNPSRLEMLAAAEKNGNPDIPIRQDFANGAAGNLSQSPAPEQSFAGTSPVSPAPQTLMV